MNNIRVKFVRGEEVKYISHLDLMKTFERSIRRSGIPIAYSQGFNPHPQMVFGLPLSVGVTSEAEYADFELSVPFSPEQFKEDLNNSLPKGLQVLRAEEKHVKDNIMASISLSRYMLLLSTESKQDTAVLREKIDEFLKNPEIIVKKEGKKGTKDVDIRPMIHSIEIVELSGPSNENESSSIVWLKGYIEGISHGLSKPSYNIDNIFCLSILVSAGSTANLKPDLLVSALEGFFNFAIKIVKIHRTELFVNIKGKNLDPLNDSILQKTNE